MIFLYFHIPLIFHNEIYTSWGFMHFSSFLSPFISSKIFPFELGFFNHWIAGQKYLILVWVVAISGLLCEIGYHFVGLPIVEFSLILFCMTQNSKTSGRIATNINILKPTFHIIYSGFSNRAISNRTLTARSR